MTSPAPSAAAVGSCSLGKAFLSNFAFRRVHFIGAGGVGMSALALDLARKGISVSGSDLGTSRYTDRLVEAGVRFHVGHAPENLQDAELVVVSTAIRDTNPELALARKNNIPVWHRSRLLAALLHPHRTVCVAGSHGKTTTSAMMGLIAQAGGFDPTVFVGGEVEAFGSNLRLGAGELAVAEADESDGSFLGLPCDMGIITNIDPEHLDYWGTAENLREGFVKFVNQSRSNGPFVVCLDDPGVRAVLPRLDRPVFTYGQQDDSADFQPRNIRLQPFGAIFELFRRGQRVGEIELSVPGLHNVLNGTAAASLALELGADIARIAAGLRNFRGVKRRFQVLGEVGDIIVIDDYAHHPTEVAATLQAAARLALTRGGRCIAVFQPHRYTRTQSFYPDFAKAFSECDHVIITEIYPAGETPIPGISGELIVDAVRKSGHSSVHFLPQIADVPCALASMLRPHDLVIGLGAGDIYKTSLRLLESLSCTEPAVSSICTGTVTAREVTP